MQFSGLTSLTISLLASSTIVASMPAPALDKRTSRASPLIPRQAFCGNFCDGTAIYSAETTPDTTFIADCGWASLQCIFDPGVIGAYCG
ncbi:hypothetical protein V8E51_015645 [Hyaloscypha variabilis]